MVSFVNVQCKGRKLKFRIMAKLLWGIFLARIGKNTFSLCRTPQDLYKNGIQRSNFLPFIDMLQEKSRVGRKANNIFVWDQVRLNFFWRGIAFWSHVIFKGWLNSFIQYFKSGSVWICIKHRTVDPYLLLVTWRVESSPPCRRVEDSSVWGSSV